MKSYPQVIHFLWKTVDKSIHRTHSKMNGVHIKTKSPYPGTGKGRRKRKNPEKSAKTAQIMLDGAFLFLYNLMRMFFSMHK